MKPIEAGKLRHRVQIFDIASNVNAAGEQSDPLDADSLKSIAGPAWAFVEPTTGRELLQPDESFGEVTHRVTMRWMPANIRPRMWMKFGKRWFDIMAVINVEERNRMLILLCKERL